MSITTSWTFPVFVTVYATAFDWPTTLSKKSSGCGSREIFGDARATPVPANPTRIVMARCKRCIVFDRSLPMIPPVASDVPPIHRRLMAGLAELDHQIDLRGLPRRLVHGAHPAMPGPGLRSGPRTRDPCVQGL